MAVLEDLEEVAAFGVSEPLQAEVVEDEQLGPGEAHHELAVALVGAREGAGEVGLAWRIVRHARRACLRLARSWPWAEALVAAFACLQALPSG